MNLIKLYIVKKDILIIILAHSMIIELSRFVYNTIFQAQDKV